MREPNRISALFCVLLGLGCLAVTHYWMVSGDSVDLRIFLFGPVFTVAGTAGLFRPQLLKPRGVDRVITGAVMALGFAIGGGMFWLYGLSLE